MIVNWTLGYMSFAIFLSILDRYFSGENYKMGEWINGRSFKFKFGLTVVVSIAPYFFAGVSADTLYVPFRVAGMLTGFYIGEFFLRSFDWAFKKPGQQTQAPAQPSGVVETVVKTIDAVTGGEHIVTEAQPKQIEEDDPTRKSVVEAIGAAGSNIKDGLKSLGEGIAKASGNILKGDRKEKEEENKKDYEPNKKLDDKLKDY